MINKLKYYITLCLLVGILQTVFSFAPVFAGQKLTPQQIKSVVEGIGINNTATVVVVKTEDKKKYRGFIRTIEEDKFIVVDRKKGAMVIPYIEVKELKEASSTEEDLGTFAKKEGIKTVLIVGAVLAVVGISIAIGSAER